MLLFLFLAVVGTLAQDLPPPPGIDLDEIVLMGADISDLPLDVQAIIGSSRFGRPVAMGTNEFPNHGGAGEGEEFADGRQFGIDIDDALSAPEARSTISSATVDSDEPAFDLSQFGIGEDGDDDIGDVVYSRSATIDSDEPAFDLSQFGIGEGGDDDNGDVVYSRSATDSDSTGFDLSQFGIGVDVDVDDDDRIGGVVYPRSATDSDYTGFDLSQFGIGRFDGDDDESGATRTTFSYDTDHDSSPTTSTTGYSDVPAFDLSQFGIYLDDENAIGSAVHSDTASDSDFTGFDLSQFGDIGDDTDGGYVSSQDTGDWSSILSQFGTDEDGRDTPGVSVAGGYESDVSTDEDVYSDFHLSQFGIDIDVVDNDKDTTSLSVARIPEEDESDFDFSQYGINLDHFGGGIETGRPHATDEYAFDLSQFGIFTDDDNKLISDSPYLSEANTKHVIKTPINDTPKKLSADFIIENHFNNKPAEGQASVDIAVKPIAPAHGESGVDLSALGLDIRSLSIPAAEPFSRQVEVSRFKSPIFPEDIFADAPQIPKRRTTAVEYASHPETPKAQQPLVPGFDTTNSLPSDWQNLIPEHSKGLSDSLKKWIH